MQVKRLEQSTGELTSVDGLLWDRGTSCGLCVTQLWARVLAPPSKGGVPLGEESCLLTWKGDASRDVEPWFLTREIAIMIEGRPED